MKDSNYWRRRSEELEKTLNGKGEEYFLALEKDYEKAASATLKEIERLYWRLAKNNVISLAEARKLLNASELDEFKWDIYAYAAFAKENTQDGVWTKELEKLSLRHKITRLEAMRVAMQNQVEALMWKEAEIVSEAMEEVYLLGYYGNAHILQTGTGTGFAISVLAADVIDKVLRRPWVSDGLTFKSRILDIHRLALTNDLNKTLTQSLIRGLSPDKAVKELGKRFDVAKNQAKRLMTTETTYFGTKAALDCYADLGIDEVEFVSVLDNRTSEICRFMDGTVLKRSEVEIGINAPPLHTNCRSSLSPYLPDRKTFRRAEDKDGTVYYVPSDMKYYEWYDKFVKEK